MKTISLACLVMLVALCESCGFDNSAVIQATPKIEHEFNSDTLKEIDFSNFSFPATKEWEAFRLIGGKSAYEPPNGKSLGKMGYSLVSEVNGSLNVCERCSAVVISVQTGGSATPHLIYLFSLDTEDPSLVWMRAFGDRAEGGLRSVSIQNSEMFIETYEPDSAKGSCCPKTYRTEAFVFHDQQTVVRTERKGIPNPDIGAPFVSGKNE